MADLVLMHNTSKRSESWNRRSPRCSHGTPPSLFSFRGWEIHRWIADDKAVLPLGLGSVHRAVRVANQVLSPLMEIGTQRDANTGSHFDVLTDADGLLEFDQDTLRHTDRVLGTAHIVNQEGKFVAAIASDHVAFSQTPMKTFGRLTEHGVAGFVAQLVINRFKPVQIDEQDGELEVPVMTTTLDGTCDLLEKLSTIGKTGEGIAHRFVSSLFFSFRDALNLRVDNPGLGQQDQGEAQQNRKDDERVRVHTAKVIQGDAIPDHHKAAQDDDLWKGRGIRRQGKNQHQ